MNKTMQDLKRIWKKLGIKGQVKNYSSKPIWVIENDSGKPVAHLLPPMTKSPNGIDADGFRRVDGKPIQGGRLHPARGQREAQQEEADHEVPRDWRWLGRSEEGIVHDLQWRN